MSEYSKFRAEPYGNGQYYVPSRRNPEEGYIVDTTETPWTCGCEGYIFRHTKYRNYKCWHIKYVAKLLGEILPPETQLTTTNIGEYYNG